MQACIYCKTSSSDCYLNYPLKTLIRFPYSLRIRVRNTSGKKVFNELLYIIYVGLIIHWRVIKFPETFLCLELFCYLGIQRKTAEWSVEIVVKMNALLKEN